MQNIKIIKLNLKHNPYNIYIGNNLLKKIPQYISKLNLGNHGIIITSRQVGILYKDRIKQIFTKNKNYKLITVVDGEGAKSKQCLLRVIEKIVKIDTLGKRIFIVCLGGGVVGDLGGFIASIYKRGIPYIQIPTTLLSQIDSSIGGKTAIDLPQAKNILGSIYQPKAVFIDPVFLKTLGSKEIKEGLAEAIKYGVIKDKAFFNFLKENHKKILKLDTISIGKLISVCVNIKVKIVAQDEKEKKGIRTILNFGHSFAHALESASKYGKITHGKAVSLGMLYTAVLSLLLNKCSLNQASQIPAIISIFGLSTKIRFNALTLYKALSYDKKFISGKIRMVILREIGKVEVVEGISPKIVKNALKKMTRFS
ncbi:MAG: 3-dehydroquinate synthase [Omnitrophica bacterium]|nr:3-dehydroquinate synthase [Candidatus Omnitrophota bacterium]